jgi:hypothetical protein
VNRFAHAHKTLAEKARWVSDYEKVEFLDVCGSLELFSVTRLNEEKRSATHRRGFCLF